VIAVGHIHIKWCGIKSIDTAGQEKQYVSWICSECKDTCGVVKIASPVEEKEVKDD